MSQIAPGTGVLAISGQSYANKIWGLFIIIKIYGSSKVVLFGGWFGQLLLILHGELNVLVYIGYFFLKGLALPHHLIILLLLFNDTSIILDH